jgi:hypothetical protein
MKPTSNYIFPAGIYEQGLRGCHHDLLSGHLDAQNLFEILGLKGPAGMRPRVGCTGIFADMAKYAVHPLTSDLGIRPCRSVFAILPAGACPAFIKCSQILAST